MIQFKQISLFVLFLTIGINTFAQTTGCVYGDCDNGYGKYVWDDGAEYTGYWENGTINGEGTFIFASGSKYTGEFINTKKNGVGTYTWTNKDRYTGHWQDDQKHGEGTFYYADGTIQSGIWQNGEYQGEVGSMTGCIFGDCDTGYGVYVWANGEKYDGNWINRKRNGQGTDYYATGNIYEGEWLDDTKNGYGTYSYVDGTSKTGMWEANKYVGTSSNNYGCISGDCSDGYGIYTWQDGERYEGYWANGKRNGQGTNIFGSGQKYVGEWKDDYRNGYGTNYYTDGSIKAGMWDMGTYLGAKEESVGCVSGDCDNGFGTFISEGGNKYVGSFSDGFFHGDGTYSTAIGDFYNGEFKNGGYDGYGTYTFADGRKYVGEFKKSNYNGIGTMYYTDGTNKSGLWESGAYMGKKEDKTPPSITWLTPQYTSTSTKDKSIDIKLCVQSASEIQNIQVYVNGTLKINSATRGYSVVSSSCDYTIEKNVPLEAGENKIVVKISNAGGVTSSDSRSVTLEQAVSVTNEKRLALIIGNGNYTSSPLRNPPNDARAIAAELRSLGFEVMEYNNLSQVEMKKHIREFGDKLAAQKGVGLFYYAGHGLQLNGENYIVPVDATISKEQDVELESVNLKRVTGEMDYAQNDLNIIILDACRNNPFARSFRSGGNNGLATTIAPKGTFIAYATAPGSVASDGTGQNGLYTQELIKALQKPGLRIEDVFKEVRLEVYNQSGKQQVPWENSSIFGDFYFKK